MRVGGVLLIAACATALTVGNAPAELISVDYITIDTMDENYCGLLPETDGQWVLGGGGCMTMVGPEYQGSFIGRYQEQMVARGWNNGPNGVAEFGQGDDVDLGPVQASWSIPTTANEAHSGEWCLADSPGGLMYQSFRDDAAEIDQVFDLTGYNEVKLRFWHRWNMRISSGSDDCDLQIMPNGADWGTVQSWDHMCGFHGLYRFEEVDLGAYIGDQIQLRFRLETTSTGRADGWFIDDIQLIADGEVLFQDDFETGTDGWILENTWGLEGDVTSLEYEDRYGVAINFDVSRDPRGKALAKISDQGLLVAEPVPLPTGVLWGQGYLWVEADAGGGKTDGVMVYCGPMSFVPE